MGCGSSSSADASENAMWVFISRTRSDGVTKELLVGHAEGERKKLVETYGFNETETNYIVSNWKMVGKAHDEHAKQIEGCVFKDRLDIPQEDDPQGKKDRVTEVAERRDVYVWKKTQHKGVDLPPFVEKVPAAENVGASHKAELFTDLHSKELALKFNHTIDVIHDKVLEMLGSEEDPFQNYSDLYRTATVPKVAADWKTDAQFGQQRFNGVNPHLIKKVSASTGIPAKFPVTDELMREVFPDGETIQSMIRANRLFMCDLEELADLPSPKDRYLTAPIALFFLDDSNALMPAAIQLYQKPTEENPIFTPNAAHTNPGTWLAAKTHFQTADGVSHEITGHYCGTHAYIEVIYISMMRNLSVYHPISELIRPHFWFTMYIQDKARESLIHDGGSVARLMACGEDGMKTLLSKSYADWKFTCYNLPKRLEARGIADAAEVPNCYYRDDGVRFFHIIETYVTAMIDDFYQKDASLITGDEELQNWAAELTGELNLKALPCAETDNKFTTKTQIVEFLTCIIFTASAGHSMVNNGQWDYWGYIPNLPATFRLKPPTSPSQVTTEKEIAAALPGYEDTADQIALVHVLSRTHPTKKIGEFAHSFMSGRPNVLPLVKKFKQDLAALSTSIQARNKGLEGHFAYPYLDPAHVSNTCDV